MHPPSMATSSRLHPILPRVLPIEDLVTFRRADQEHIVGEDGEKEEGGIRGEEEGKRVPICSMIV